MLLNKLYGNYYTRILHEFSKQTKNISCTILIEVKTKTNTLQYSTYSVQNMLFNYNKKTHLSIKKVNNFDNLLTQFYKNKTLHQGEFQIKKNAQIYSNFRKYLKHFYSNSTK